jgi:hypothetical protein
LAGIDELLLHVLEGFFEFGVELKLLDYDPQRGVERQKLTAQWS